MKASTALLVGCTVVLSPIYPVTVDDVPVGGTFSITYEPITEKEPNFPDYNAIEGWRSNLDINPYEVDKLIQEYLRTLPGIHDVRIEADTGMIECFVRPLMVMDPRQGRKLWDKVRLYFMHEGVELAPWIRFDPDEYRKAYFQWLETLK